MIYLLIGRTGSGKDYLQKLLEDRGLKPLKSYATRPKRTPDEDSHIFISHDEAEKITDKAAYTQIGDYEYFSTRTQLRECDTYIIDPAGLDDLLRNVPDETYHIVYIEAEDDTRKIHAIKRAENKIQEEERFTARCDAEDAMFSEFEKKLVDMADNGTISYPDCVTSIEIYNNEYDKENAEQFADYLMLHKTLHDRMINIIHESINMGIIRSVDGGTSVFTIIKEDAEQNVPVERFADMVITNAESMQALMSQYIIRSDRFSDNP